MKKIIIIVCVFLCCSISCSIEELDDGSLKFKFDKEAINNKLKVDSTDTSPKKIKPIKLKTFKNKVIENNIKKEVPSIQIGIYDKPNIITEKKLCDHIDWKYAYKLSSSTSYHHIYLYSNKNYDINDKLSIED